MKFLLSLSLLFLLNGCQNHSKNQPKSWVLNPQFSSISLISTKNNSITEVFEFKKIKGAIKNNYLTIEIDLNSLESNIPIRNERIQKHLFQTDIFPTADIHTVLKADDLTVGVHEITFDVDLHGISGIITAQFMVFEQFGNKVITLHKPLIVTAKTFNLQGGINTLKNLAKLSSINLTVPVNLTLTFEAK